MTHGVLLYRTHLNNDMTIVDTRLNIDITHVVLKYHTCFNVNMTHNDTCLNVDMAHVVMKYHTLELKQDVMKYYTRLYFDLTLVELKYHTHLNVEPCCTEISPTL